MRRFLSFVFASVLLIAPCAALAQDASQAVASRQQDLQNQLNDIENQINAQQQLLSVAQNQHQTLQTQIDAFNAQIKTTQLQIQAIALTVTQLNGDIGVHNQTLSQLSDQLSAEKESLAQIMRQTQMLDDYSVVNVALGSQDVSGLFSDLDAFASIKSSLADSFSQIQHTSSSTEAEKQALETRLAEQQQLQTAQQVAKQSLLTQQQAKQSLLTQTKGVEANYQSLIAKNQKTAAQIRTELFQLAGGGGQIPLPTAITLAKQAGAATGVRPAFILGILEQETNLGANVGQCLLTNTPNRGDGKGKNTGTPFSGVMAPNRDVGPFLTLVSALGLDWTAMPVSCPQRSAGGYGGAMGPAQFIASTWTSYEARISTLAGHSGTPANPWDNLDAFTAIGLYMDDLGASAQTPTAERTAALHYFAGSSWSKPAFAIYGDNVMQYAANFQSEINILNGY
jgi:peptidoglycan hydrolase CwlO-like protein